MPVKIATYASYGQKLISLFVKLLVSEESRSLTEFSRMLRCSKQTVIRYIDDIRRAYGVDIEETFKGNRKYYRIKKLRTNFPTMNLTESEIMTLQLCRAFSEHLLGHDLYQEAAHALEKSAALLLNKRSVSSQHFGSVKPGSIDYTPHQDSMRTLIEAMEKNRVCKIAYKSIVAKRAKTFYIKPLKLFSHKDTIYLNTRMAKTPGKKYREPDFDPLLVIHRIVKVELTDRVFDYPDDYDFEKIFNKNFGVIKEDSFKVEIEFSGWAGSYVSERIWSPDQKITRKRDGKIKLKLSASSEPELISWVLSFGLEAKVIKPDWLASEINSIVKGVSKKYINGKKADKHG